MKNVSVYSGIGVLIDHITIVVVDLDKNKLWYLLIVFNSAEFEPDLKISSSD